jgi:hypothetical protein
MSLSIAIFLFLFNDKIILCFLFTNDVNYYLFKVFVKSAHVDLTQLLLGLVNLLVFYYVFVH